MQTWVFLFTSIFYVTWVAIPPFEAFKTISGTLKPQKGPILCFKFNKLLENCNFFIKTG